MERRRAGSLAILAASIAVLVLTGLGRPGAQPGGNPAVRVGSTDLGGLVTSASGPEAGVWVIAETTELPTGFARIVVTDERGRYLVPDLPRATYRVWVRGYGLVDSPPVQATPGTLLDLRAVVAPTEAAAAEYYPAIYWYAMLRVPETREFPGTGPDGNGIPVTLRSQAQWLDVIKTNGCYACHQLGNKATRTIPAALGPFASPWTPPRTRASMPASMAWPSIPPTAPSGARCWASPAASSG